MLRVLRSALPTSQRDSAIREPGALGADGTSAPHHRHQPATAGRRRPASDEARRWRFALKASWGCVLTCPRVGNSCRRATDCRDIQAPDVSTVTSPFVPRVALPVLMANKVLVINAGSSSLKFKLFENANNTFRALMSGLVERIGDVENSQMVMKDLRPHEPEKSQIREPLPDHSTSLQRVLGYLQDTFSQRVVHEVRALGHRVVHGKTVSDPVLITEDSLRLIEEAAELAPLHNPANLEGIRAAQAVFKGQQQVAVFDTAFHTTMPPAAFMYAIPYRFYEQYQLRKYGAHGTSYKFLLNEASRILEKPAEELNVIAAHLGAGASITAIKQGKSVDTSMGLTPLEGLVMGTRCGDLDASIVPHMVHRCGVSLQEVDKMLNRESGFKGLAGVSDLRAVLEAAAAGDYRASMAFDVYIHRLRRYIGAYLVELEGNVDAIIFSAGAGESCVELRREALRGLEAFGIALDDGKNRAAIGKEAAIHAANSRIQVLVVPTDEELSIAQQTMELVRSL